MSASRSKTSEYLLLGGAILGALLAATDILQATSERNHHAVATVNGEAIGKSEYLGFLDLLVRNKRNPVTDADRRQVLERIIEERLLVDRGLELGIAQSDPSVRKVIVKAMIETITSEASTAIPNDAELRQFYADNKPYFTTTSRVRARRMIFRGEGARERAAKAHGILSRARTEPASEASVTWDEIAARYADADILSLPASLLPLNKVRGYLGPAQTKALLELEVGAFSTVLPAQNSRVILQLVERTSTSPPMMTTIYPQVLREFQRRASDTSLRNYLEQLRAQADITTDSGFLTQLGQLKTETK